MRIDLPVSGVLIAGSTDLILVGHAGAVGAVHFGPWQGIDSELHHEEVHAKHYAKERDHHEKDLGPGQRLRRNQRSIHAKLLFNVTDQRNYRLPMQPHPTRYRLPGISRGWISRNCSRRVRLPEA